MASLQNTIDELLEWGKVKKENKESNFVELEQQLIGLYQEFFRTPEVFDGNEYPDPPELPESYKANIKFNFPQLGFYNTSLNLFSSEPEFGVGDGIDDVTDILTELWRVRWCLDHTSIDDAQWHFRFAFENHIKGHLIGLLWYMAEYKYKDHSGI